MNKVKGPRTVVYAVGSFAYLFVILLDAWRLGYFDPKGTPLNPSEWGDVLAGVFSPLAFLWLLYASLSQRAELELQREELRQNNKTQDEQRAEMKRQVEAMSAQAKLLAAQATAKYDPVFVISETSGSPSTDNFFIIYVRNHGGDVLNVRPEGDVMVSEIHRNGRQKIVGNIIPLWKTGEVVSFVIGNDPVGSGSSFVLKFQRLDAIEKRNVYALRNRAQRLELKASEEKTSEVNVTVFLDSSANG